MAAMASPSSETKKKGGAMKKPGTKMKHASSTVKSSKSGHQKGRPDRLGHKGSDKAGGKPEQRVQGANKTKKRPASTASGTPDRKKRKFSDKEKGNVAGDPSESSKPSKPVDRKAKKALVESRKRKRKPNYDLEKEAVLLWEKMRQRNLNPEERKSLVSETLTKMKGKLLEMAKSHTSSRVLQSCVKHCQEAERVEVFQELRPHFLDLALNTYACHLAQRMLDHAKKDQLQQMITVLHGNVVRLLRHPTGSIVLEHAYQLANGSQKRELVSEFFSPEYRLFKNIIPNGRGRISEILSGEPVSKRKTVLEHMTLSIQPILEKGIVDHSIFHRALVEYLSICPEKLTRNVVEQLSGTLLVRMIHTADGSKLGILCLRNGTPKERKKIVKGMKTQVLKVAHDDHGYAVLLSVFDVVDDTELVSKVIMSELAKGIKDLCLNKYGHRLILHLLAPNVPRYFPADLLKILKCPIEHFSGGKVTDDSNEPEPEAEKSKQDVAEDGEDGDENVGVSKKDPLVRRTELLLKGGFGEKLAEACAANAGELLRTPVGKDVLYEVACGGVDEIMLEVAQEGITAVHKAIADLAALPKDEQTGEHVLEHYHASRTIRRLVLDSRCYSKDKNLKSFAEILWNTALKGRCKTWAQGHSAKVVAAFLDTEDPAVKLAAKSELESLVSSGLLSQSRKGASNR